jgi:hypothetical protein
MKYFLFFLLLVLTVGCGLKPAPLMQNEVIQKGKDLFESVQVSERETYVVRSLKKELLAGETNSVQYRWVSAELTELDATPRSFKVENAQCGLGHCARWFVGSENNSPRKWETRRFGCF